ncbi:MAG TPA: substrate-binding domain-containing protein [Opitutaceae bacterium]|nr:substrate-binding domain-containing protein [Opitutaceae bacterium]
MNNVSSQTNRIGRRFAHLALGFALCFNALVASAVPAHVLITAPASAPIPAGFETQLAAWRQSGQVAGVLLLEPSQKEKSGFSAFVDLEFPSDSSCDIWQREAGPSLPPGLVIRRADVLTHGEISPRDSNKSIFVVSVNQPIVAPETYKQFASAFITPMLNAQNASKILIRHTLFLERDPAGKGQAVLVCEYRDSVAFGRMAAVKGEARAKLVATSPAYVKANETKDSIRTAVSETQAAYVEPPAPELPDLPPYKVEFKVVGGLRIVGSELKNAVDYLAEGFAKFHPDSRVTTSHIPSSEGGIAGLYCGISDVAPMGDDAKITDMMPFYNATGYMPLEISVATGGYEKRGSLFAWAIVVSKDNPLNEISVDELERTFGSERSGGWELVDGNYLYTAKYARTAANNIRKWDQLGLSGEFVGKEIETFGYCAPGFATYFERNWFHWSKKWNGNFQEYVEFKQATPDAAGLAVVSDRPLEALAKNKFAIGIAALMHAKDYPDLKVLKISQRKGGPAIAFTPDNVANRTYPLIRDAFFYLNKPPGRPLDPKAREFMRFVLSREGQEIIARVGYYYPLKADYLKEQLKKLD